MANFPDSGATPAGPAGSGLPAQATAGFTTVAELRARARRDLEQGAVTSTYHADRAAVLALLDQALATELVCVLRYKRHYFMAKGVYADSVAQEFAEHAREEQDHADRLAQRIVQLGGAPDLAPDTLAARAHSQYVEAGDNLIEMLRENLIAERIAIDSYREMVAFIGASDSTTRRLLEEILAVEEEHAEDLLSLLEGPAGKIS